MILFAVDLSDPQTILDSANSLSESVDGIVAVLWELLKTPLFIAICNVGAFIAALSVGLWALKLIKANVNSDVIIPPDHLSTALTGILLIILLGTPTNRGTMLSTVLVEADALSTRLSTFVVELARTDPEIDPVQNTQVQQAVTDRAITDYGTCAALPVLSQERAKCIDESVARVTNSLAKFISQEWATKLQIRLVNGLEALKGPGADGLRGQASTPNPLLYLANKAVSSAISGILFVITAAWLLALRITKPLIAIIFPLYIGLSFIPSSNPPVVFGIGLFIDLAVVEIVYKVWISMVAQLILLMPPTDPLIMPLLLTFIGIPASWILGRRLAGGLIEGGFGLLSNLRSPNLRRN